jgi:hypothetical protein
MEIRRSLTLLLLAVSVGFIAGWLCKSQPATPYTGSGKTSALSRAELNPTSRSGSSVRPQGSSASSVSSKSTLKTHFATELESLRRLSDAEFARRMVDTWFAGEDPDNLLSRALFAEACDSGKAGAFYDEFKRRKGLSGQEEGGRALREFMTMTGKRFGAELAQKMLETHPQGMPELDSLIHGWVTVEPTQAVEWLNSLPEDCPFYSRSLKGIVFGIGEISPASAADIFLKLPAEERNKKFVSLAGGFIRGQGIAGLNEMAAHFPNETDRVNLLMSSLHYSMEQPPAEFVDGMAGHLSSVPDLSQPLQIMAGRWVKTAPTDAIAWLEKNADNADQAPALGVMASQLSKGGHGDAVIAWLAAHPQSPGRAAVEAGRQPGRKAE